MAFCMNHCRAMQILAYICHGKDYRIGVTGQLVDKPTRIQSSCGLVNSPKYLL